ncbi:MAG: hypothetical protein WDO14_09405 [Bacteroidota bacterium]
MVNKLLLLIAFISISSYCAAQEDPGPGTVTVFSEDGAKFTLYVNGERKNATPDTRVVANMAEVPFQFRIVFEDSKIPEIDKRGIRQGKHCLYAIVSGKKGHQLKVGGCSNDAPTDVASTNTPATTTPVETTPTSAPAQLSATYKDGVISINDGRTLKVTKVKANGMTYPRIHFTALQGAKVSLKYDNGNESYEGESPIQYEVKDYQNNNAYVTVTVDEGGAAKTWHVKLQNANGYDLKIEDK